MSGVIKAVRKVFKKVVKVVKKVAPIVLTAAAIYFTAGAALGIAGTAGGWGGAVSGVVGKLGLGSTLSGVLTGAVTQAGYGAVLGGGIAAVTGGDVSKGLLRGATVGAVTGGVLGGFGLPTDPLKGIGETPTTVIPRLGKVATDTPGLLSKVGGFIEKNPVTAGLAIQGVGSGISGLAGAKAEIEAAELRSRDEERKAERIAGNFGVGGGGLLTGVGLPAGAVPDTTPRPTPAQQFNPATVLARSRGSMWRYNPETGQIELTSTA